MGKWLFTLFTLFLEGKWLAYCASDVMVLLLRMKLSFYLLFVVLKYI